MDFTPFKLNFFTFFKLPSAWWCGVRVTKIEERYCETKVVHRWINQNPFTSMFWAVQGMAAELATGVLVMKAIKEHDRKVSMLVLNNRANFSKKARGRIIFSSDASTVIDEAFNELIKSKEPQTFWLTSKGIDQEDHVVSTFEFEWTVLLKK
jgi:hypothetical protein|tara:strand:- start:737 stop:1192 length:456 start_codon:yes stop_codon:yes gene_type:complete